MELGKTMILVGILLILGPKIPFLGNLPGDIKIDRQNFKFYFPLGTCILISLILSFFAWLISKK